MQKECIGMYKFTDVVDITDPAYDKDVWCRISRSVHPGRYDCIVWMHKDSY